MFLVGDAISWARKELGSQQGSSETLSEDEAKAAMATANGAIRDGAETIASAIARTVAPDRTAANARKQAFYDAMYLIAGSDGGVSPQEKAKLVIGLRGLLGESFDEAEVDDGLEMGRVLVDERGVKGAAAAVAEAITDAAERSLLLTMASVSAWLGGGVGTKEGLALQALAAAFEIPINKLHEAMAAAAKIGKAI
jgi:tellurite resistance protein